MTEEENQKQKSRFPKLVGEKNIVQNAIKLWRNTTDNLQKLLPKVNQITRFWSVSEEEVAEILATVKKELPTTEALLIGKPQAGKSSIVRGLTGVSSEIIGQGFRPHTQNTQRYAYPSEDLPLLIFTDTVGLGDVEQGTENIIQELEAELAKNSDRANIIILTVKINDFALDTLKQIATKLRNKYPQIPFLLTVTCLHEVYPPQITDHPSYPPEYQEVTELFTVLQENFADLCDRAILIDFTLEEDGYHPIFYGLETLRDTLAQLLPEAEAKAIYQLLDQGAGEEIGNLYRNTARRYIIAFSTIAATLAAVPLPFATMPVLTALQVSLVGLLGKLYGQTLNPSQAGGIVSTIAGGFFAQAVGRELIR